jgi:recombination protein RecA
MTASSLATLRSKIESDLRGRVASPFAYRDRNAFELVSTGVPEMDDLVGGLPRGAMTEICGAACSGRTSLLLSVLASRTAEGEACALVDGRDSFDPLSADAAGIALGKLLWVRCQNIEQALRATDLLIQAGGFGMVAVDLSDVPARTVRQVPLSAWFRFRRAVEDTPTIFLLLEQEPHAKTCASLVVRLEAGKARWTEAAVRCHPFAKLLRGFSSRADVVRSRLQMPELRVVNIREGTQPKMAAPLGVFKTGTIWSR